MSPNFAHAESNLAFDSALGVTSNADLSATNPVADRIFTVGGVAKFSGEGSTVRTALKYTDYAKTIENDLLSADIGETWKRDPEQNAKEFGLKLIFRDYLHDAPASTDQGFTHFGLAGDLSWRVKQSLQTEWLFAPRVEIEHYPSYFNRTDFGLSFLFEHTNALSSESNLTISASPDLLLSTLGDFSKLSFVFTLDYDQMINEETSWGAGVFLIPGFYLSRLASATSSIVTRSKGKAGSSTSIITSKTESTVTLSPNIWWSKELTESFDLRLESSLNFQSSKSGSYDYSEIQAFAAIHYRAF
jgi:hypothetical protein